MNYRLVVLSHGAHADLVARSLASFRRYVTPAPLDAYFHVDGLAPRSPALHVVVAIKAWPWTIGVTHDLKGFCASCQECWYEGAAHAGADYVFWLEHDFVFTRPVDLTALAAALDQNRMLAQMALMRGPVSPAEKEAGGLFESRPGQYDSRLLTDISREPGDLMHLWLEHRSYFTTNPSLMRRGFMAENPWPDYPEQCEGRFGIDLVARGYSFGVWGQGEPWVEHVGVRDGTGY